ncbi:MAG: glycosyltransferase [Clostridia bacterium]|nr:glycosyltransferase [Clostridia bacterium]
MKKKLLFVVHTLQIGGAEKILINVLKYISKRKYDITVLALVDDGVLVDEVKNIEGIKYKYVFKSYFKKARSNKESKFYKISCNIMNSIWKKYLKKIKYNSKKLYEKYVNEKYDVEIAFLEGKVSKFVSCSNNEESRKIAWIHTDINVGTNSIFIDDDDEKKCYETFDKIVCVSGDVRNRFIQKTGRDKNVFVQINPVDCLDILEKSKEELSIKKNADVPVVCTVGRLVQAKGFDRLLEVHKRLIDENIDHELWIIGEGIERRKLEDYIRKNKLGKSARLMGYSSNPYKYVKNSDVFVCASRVEGLSTVIVEATILDKVIVSTDCPGAKDILGDDNECALVVNNDAAGIYEGLKAVLTNEELKKKYQTNIKKRSELFNLRNTIGQIEDIIDG